MRRLRDALLAPQRNDGIDAHRSPRGNVTRCDRNNNHQHGHTNEGNWVMRTDAEELVGHETRESHRGNDANRDANERHPRPVSNYQPQHIVLLRPQGHAHADFVSPLADQIRNHAVDSDAREH